MKELLLKKRDYALFKKPKMKLSEKELLEKKL
jgi:hypothetical protein